MSKYPYHHNRDELKTLLLQYENLKAGKSQSFIDEEVLNKSLIILTKKMNLPKHWKQQSMA